MGPKRKEKFSRNCREENSGGSETESASQPVLTFSSRQPAVPTPGSSGQCLRLQVSVCCKESSKWVGARGAALWLGARLGKEGRHGESLGDVEGFREGCKPWPPLPSAACGSSHCSLCWASRIPSPGARPSKASAELVVLTGRLGETWKLGFGEDKVVGYGEGAADLKDPGE